jgi:hypothetical protein
VGGTPGRRALRALARCKAPERTIRSVGEPARFGRATAIALTVVALGVLAAACRGGSASLGVASLRSTTTSAPASGSAQGGNNSANYTAAVEYSGCMRTHGVPNFPDPTSSGVFLSRQRNEVDRSSSQFASANKACLHLLPNGGEPTSAQTQQGLAQELKLAQCMRSHGVPDFPDPQLQPHNRISLRVGGPGFDPNSPQYQAANSACKHFTPGGIGLP